MAQTTRPPRRPATREPLPAQEISREVLLAVPSAQREAALALGATRWEAAWTAVVPYARSGIFGAVILGLGRALGETMAVTMLIGNRHDLSASLFAPGYTMAASIANEFAEATADIHLAALTLFAALSTLAGCSQNGAEPPKSASPTATVADEDKHPEAAGEHADEADAPLSMTAAEQASAGLRVETLLSPSWVAWREIEIVGR